MNNSLQNLVANYYENAGFKNLAAQIRKSKDNADIRCVAVSVLSKLMKTDPNGFGQDVKNLCMEGDSTNEKN